MAVIADTTIPRQMRHQDSTDRRVIAYIDGYNVYHGLQAKGYSRYLWLDHRALLNGKIRDGEVLEVALFPPRAGHACANRTDD